MNFKLSDRIAETFKTKGYNVTTDASKASDYVSIYKKDEVVRCVVRISDHNSCTARSDCAAIEFVISDLMDDNTALIGFDEDGDVVYDEFEFNNKEDRDDLILSAVVAEIESTQEFYNMSKLG